MCVAELAGKVHVSLKEQANRITNGLTASRDKFPWLVALIINGAYFCCGILISDRWVLTAAHCAYLYTEMRINGSLQIYRLTQK